MRMKPQLFSATPSTTSTMISTPTSAVCFSRTFSLLSVQSSSMQVLASLRIALIISLCVFLTFFELMGIMWMLNVVIGGYPIEMNAVLVVNLVTSLGFGVEFCNHIGMNFLRQK